MKVYLFVTIILVCNELSFVLKRLAVLKQEIVSIVHNWIHDLDYSVESE